MVLKILSFCEIYRIWHIADWNIADWNISNWGIKAHVPGWYHLLSGFSSRLYNRHEPVGFQACSTDESTVDVGLRKKRGRVLRIHAPPVLYDESLGDGP